MTSGFNWSWADYERCKRAEERKAPRAAAKAAAQNAEPGNVGTQGDAPCSDDCGAVTSGRAEAGSVVARSASRNTKIDITRAPSLMEGKAEQWAEASPRRASVPAEPAPSGNQVLCRCGSRFDQGSGFVPSWFGDKCIEGACPLRCIANRKEAA